MLASTLKKRLLWRGSGGTKISTLSEALVSKHLRGSTKAQVAVSFWAGTGDYVVRCRQTAYDTGYIALLFVTKFQL
jgi:hypothetical protein